jgi:hypothetical protein
VRIKTRRYEKPLSIKMTRHLHRSSNPLFRQRVKPSARVYDRKRQPPVVSSVDWRSGT